MEIVLEYSQLKKRVVFKERPPTLKKKAIPNFLYLIPFKITLLPVTSV